MPYKIENADIADTTTKPLSRQTSVQSTNSVTSVITPTDISENQSSIVGPVSTDNSLSRTSSVKRDSIKSRNSGGGGDQEPLIELSETTELLCEM